MGHTINTLIALGGALGIFFVFSAITNALMLKVPTRSRTPLSDLDRLSPLPQGQMERVTLLEGQPLLDRLITPFLADSGHTLASLLGRATEDDETRLRKAGFPYRTVGDVYAAKVLGMIALFVLGAFFITLMKAPQMVILPLGLGLAGMFLPDWQIGQETKKRTQFLRTEMAFTLDRIALAMTAGQSLSVALHGTSAEGGGLFTNELKAVCTQMHLGKKPEEAFQEMLDRCPRLPDLDKFVERCQMSLGPAGFPIAESLTSQADMIRSQVEGEMLATGLTSTLVIVAITGLFALPAIGVVVLGPAFFLAAGSGFL